jgi:hypothetical protein
MNSNTLESHWRAAKRHMADLWSTEDHTAPYGLGARPAYMSPDDLEVQKHFRPASALARMTARFVAATKPGMSKKEIKQQVEALSTWEDEGGTAAATKSKGSDTPKQ